jgi:hypothetical protein
VLNTQGIESISAIAKVNLREPTQAIYDMGMVVTQPKAKTRVQKEQPITL